MKEQTRRQGDKETGRKTRMTFRLLVSLSTCLLVCAGCSHSAPPAAAEKHNAPTNIATVSPQRKAIRRVIEQPGTIQAFEETPLVGKVAGYVSAVKADIGDRVHGPQPASKNKPAEPGQILAEISVPELDQEARQKEAEIKQASVGISQAKKALTCAEASVGTAEASKREAQAALTRAEANLSRWKSEAHRVAELVQNKVLDEQTRDETNNQLQAAESSLQEAQARVETAFAQIRKAQADRDKSDIDVRAAEARLQVAQAEASRVYTMLTYTKIRAPFDGVVTRRGVDTGHFLQPGNGKNEVIFVVARLDPVRIFVDVPESDAGLISDGTDAKVIVQALRGTEINAKVTRTSWALQPGARTLRTEIDLPNGESKLRPGMYVYTRLSVDLPAAWSLPATSLIKQGDEFSCIRVVDHKAERITVLLGPSDGEWTQVLKWRKPGTKDWQDWKGDEKVIANAVGVSDGQAIQ
jgi:HlyD family secretion protein